MNKHSESPKQARKRKKIINTAIKLFVKYGTQGTSMQSLAKKAGVATGSIYNYFENKEALVNAIYLLILEEENQYIVQDYDETASVEQRFRYLLRRSIQYKLDNPEKFQFKSIYTFSPLIMKEISDRAAPEENPFAALAVDGQAAGLIKDIRLEDLFYFAHGGLASLLRWKQFNQQDVSAADVDDLINLTWDTIKR